MSHLAGSATWKRAQIQVIWACSDAVFWKTIRRMIITQHITAKQGYGLLTIERLILWTKWLTGRIDTLRKNVFWIYKRRMKIMNWVTDAYSYNYVIDCFCILLFVWACITYCWKKVLRKIKTNIHEGRSDPHRSSPELEKSRRFPLITYFAALDSSGTVNNIMKLNTTCIKRFYFLRMNWKIVVLN